MQRRQQRTFIYFFFCLASYIFFASYFLSMTSFKLRQFPRTTSNTKRGIMKNKRTALRISKERKGKIGFQAARLYIYTCITCIFLKLETIKKRNGRRIPNYMKRIRLRDMREDDSRYCVTLTCRIPSSTSPCVYMYTFCITNRNPARFLFSHRRINWRKGKNLNSISFCLWEKYRGNK